MASNYVTPDPKLVQNFNPATREAFSSQEILQQERAANPYGVDSRQLVFTKNFTLNELKEEGLTLKFSGAALKTLGKSNAPEIEAGLGKFNLRTDLHADVPSSLLVLNAVGTGWSAKKMSLDVECKVNGLAPTIFSNNPSPAYTGSHFIVPAGSEKSCTSDESIKIHSAPENLRLIDAINSHDLDPEDLDAHVVGTVEHGDELFRLVKLDANNNPYDKVFNSESGRRFLAEQMKGVTPTLLDPNDPNSPKVVPVKKAVYDKGYRAILRSKLSNSKHTQIIDTSDLSITVFPLIAEKEDISWANIEKHPYFANKTPQEIARQMNKPRQMHVSLRLDYIPKYRK